MISKNIKQLREIKGISLKELSRRSGVAASTLSEIENNKNKNPRTETLAKISFALDTNVDSLINDNNIDILHNIVKSYDVNEEIAEFLYDYTQLDPEMRDVIKKLIKTSLQSIKKEANK